MSNPNLYDFNSTFFLSLATMTFGFCAGALGYALRSKCSSVKLCGCIEIIRDVELEAEIEEQIHPVAPPATDPPTRETSPVQSRRQSRLNVVDFTTSMTSRV